MRIGRVDEARITGPRVSRVEISSLVNHRTSPREALKAATFVRAGLRRKAPRLKGIAPSG